MPLTCPWASRVLESDFQVRISIEILIGNASDMPAGLQSSRKRVPKKRSVEILIGSAFEENRRQIQRLRQRKRQNRDRDRRRQTDRQTDRQTEGETEREREKH